MQSIKWFVIFLPPYNLSVAERFHYYPASKIKKSEMQEKKYNNKKKRPIIA